MKWYKNAGIGVESSTQNWGTYYTLAYSGNENYFTYDGSSVSAWTSGSFSHSESTWPVLYHGSGLNSNGIKKNIADLGGNVWEWTTEAYSSNRVVRGGAGGAASNFPASYRSYDSTSYTGYGIGFRCVLYIQ
jgi:hypothetical protein